MGLLFKLFEQILHFMQILHSIHPSFPFFAFIGVISASFEHAQTESNQRSLITLIDLIIHFPFTPVAAVQWSGVRDYQGSSPRWGKPISLQIVLM